MGRWNSRIFERTTPPARAVRSRHIVRRRHARIGSWRSMSMQYKPPRLSARPTDLRCESSSAFSTITGNVSDMKIAASKARSGRVKLLDRTAVEVKMRHSLCGARPRSSSASDRCQRPRIHPPPANGRGASRRMRCRGCGAPDFCDAASRPAAEKSLRPESRPDFPDARAGRRRDIGRCSVPSPMSVATARVEIDA